MDLKICLLIPFLFVCLMRAVVWPDFSLLCMCVYTVYIYIYFLILIYLKTLTLCVKMSPEGSILFIIPYAVCLYSSI